MNTRIQQLITLAAAVALSPGIVAAEDGKPKAKESKKEMRVLTAPDHAGPMSRLAGPDKIEKEIATFLGVDVSVVSQTLSAQLGLPRESGLVVNHVAPESPAAGVLQAHDILLKLDDQILIEPRQLSVLIRQRKDGDEVSLLYVRGGKEATAKVKLAQREVPKLSAVFEKAIRGGAGVVGLRDGKPFDLFVPDERERADHVLSLIQRPAASDYFRMHIEPRMGPGFRAMSVNTANGHLAFEDEKGSLNLTIKEGEKTLVAKSAKGDEVFSGPVTTPEQRKAMPPEVRSRLERLEGMRDVTFRTDGDFQGAETKVVRPLGRGIAVPFHAPVLAPHRPAQDRFF